LDPNHVEGKKSNLKHLSQIISKVSTIANKETHGKLYLVKKKENPPVQCDIYPRKWACDYLYSLYHVEEFPYISGAFDCTCDQIQAIQNEDKNLEIVIFPGKKHYISNPWILWLSFTLNY